MTPTEIETLKELIESQAWLTESEKQFLINQIDPLYPPTPEEFKNWLQEIRQAAESLASEANPTLVELGIALAQLHGTAPLHGTLTLAKDSLSSIDSTLGLIKGEVLYNFYPERRTTVTQGHSTQLSFSVDMLAKILDGDQAAVINKVKTIIADPQFAYLDTDNLFAYRQKVMHWSRQLAHQGFGSIAYPK